MLATKSYARSSTKTLTEFSGVPMAKAMGHPVHSEECRTLRHMRSTNKGLKMKNLEMLLEAGITLPFRLSKAEHGPLIKKAFEERTLQRLVQMDKNPDRNHGPGCYRSSNGPCAIGCVIPDALANWLDQGNADGYYTIISLKRIGVFSYENDEEFDWFYQLQSAHDAGTKHRIEQMAELLKEV